MLFGGFHLHRALANPVAEVVELGATNLATGNHLDLGDAGAVDGVDPLDAGSVGNFTDGEGLVHTAATFGEDDALENLDPLLAAFDHSVVNLDGITDIEVGDV